MPVPLPQRVPENAPGDFYVVAGVCLRCCLPHGEAPELMDDPDQSSGDCYFRRQPRTPDEVDQAINAIRVSDLCALRYGGSDETIIRKLRQRHAAGQCDQTPEGQARLKEWERICARQAAASRAAARPLRWWERLLGSNGR